MTASSNQISEAPTGKRTIPKWIWVALVLIIFVVGFSGLLLADWMLALPVDQQATYVGRQNCIDCHQQQADSFHHSHHDLAMDLATPETVLADFDGEEIEHYGVRSKVFQRDGKFFVNTDGPDGKMADFEVKYVFGYEPLQQYMVELEPPTEGAPEGAIGRVQVLRLSWDTEKKRWFYLSPPDVDEKLDPDDPLHWTGITQCWNSSCADCHSTNLQKNFDVDSNSYATTFSEIDVSCEACHGPGSLHVEIAKNRTFFWDRHHGKGLAKLKVDDHRPQIETCAKCHSRRAQIHDSYHPGHPFLDSYVHELVSEQAYHADGQIKDEDYVYGSFLQSKMFHKGIRCTDCHDPHSTKVLHEGNKLCTSCHQHPAEKYDTPVHHHHKIGSTGASCVECHMPETTYMAVDPRRDHSIRVPRPDLSVKLGTPNACTGCHIDAEKLPEQKRDGLKQYLDWILKAETGDEAIAAELKRLDQWSLDAVENWYGAKEYPEHFAEIFSSARKGDKGAVDKLKELINNPEVSDIIRATAVSELNRFPGDEPVEIAIEALDDREPMVVNSAVERLSGEMMPLAMMAAQSEDREQARKSAKQLEQIIDALKPLLNHSTRLVRTQAARALVSVPEGQLYEYLSKDERQKLDEAIDEFIDAQMVSAERSRAHMVVGRLYEETGNDDRAIKFYRNAIHVDPASTVARRNLAAVLDRQMNELMYRGQVLAQQGNRDAAMQLGERIGELETQINELRQEELQQLEVEIKRIGDNPSAADLYYQYGTAKYLSGDIEATEEYLGKAVELQPKSTRFILALAYLYQSQKRWEKAFELKNRLLELDPTNAEFLRFEQELLDATRGLKSGD